MLYISFWVCADCTSPTIAIESFKPYFCFFLIPLQKGSKRLRTFILSYVLSNSNLWTKGFNISARMPSFEKAPVALCILPFIFTSRLTQFSQVYKQFIIIKLHSLYSFFITLNECVYYLDHAYFILFYLRRVFIEINRGEAWHTPSMESERRLLWLSGFRGHQRGRLLVQTGDRYPIAIDQRPK